MSQDLIVKAEYCLKLCKIAAGETELKSFFSSLTALVNSLKNKRTQVRVNSLRNKVNDILNLVEAAADFKAGKAKIEASSDNTAEGKAKVIQETQDLFEEIKAEYLGENDEIQDYNTLVSYLSDVVAGALSMVGEIGDFDVSTEDQQVKNALHSAYQKATSIIVQMVAPFESEIPEVEELKGSEVSQDFDDTKEKGKYFDKEVNVYRNKTEGVKSRLEKAKEQAESGVSSFSKLYRIHDTEVTALDAAIAIEKDPEKRLFLINQRNEAAKKSLDYKKDISGRMRKFYDSLKENTIRKSLALFNKNKNAVNSDNKSSGNLKKPFEVELEKFQMKQLEILTPEVIKRTIIQSLDNKSDIRTLSPGDFNIVNITIGDEQKTVDFNQKIYDCYAKFCELAKIAIIAKAKELGAAKLVQSVDQLADTERAKEAMVMHRNAYTKAMGDVLKEVTSIINSSEEMRKLVMIDPKYGQIIDRLSQVQSRIVPIMENIYQEYTAKGKDKVFKEVYDGNLSAAQGLSLPIATVLEGLRDLVAEAEKNPVFQPTPGIRKVLGFITDLKDVTQLTIDGLKAIAESGEDIAPETPVSVVAPTVEKTKVEKPVAKPVSKPEVSVKPIVRKPISGKTILDEMVPELEMSVGDAIREASTGDTTAILALKPFASRLSEFVKFAPRDKAALAIAISKVLKQMGNI
jgi:hypothetical protein